MYKIIYETRGTYKQKRWYQETVIPFIHTLLVSTRSVHPVALHITAVLRMFSSASEEATRSTTFKTQPM